MNISFAWTTEAFLAGRKTCTRRDWTPRYFKMWVKAWDEGRLIHKAWDKSPRFGGKCLGPIKMTRRPYMERLGDMTEADLEAEGGLWDSVEDYIELQGGNPDKFMAVIWFAVVNEHPNPFLIVHPPSLPPYR